MDKKKKKKNFFFFNFKKKGGGGPLIRACSLIRSNTVHATHCKIVNNWSQTAHKIIIFLPCAIVYRDLRE